jgi:uncharacterized protein (DUF433 family)
MPSKGVSATISFMIDWSTCPAVERDPQRVSGAWVFRGTRVPVTALFENLEDGAQVSQFVQWFPGVSVEQVRAVLKHAARSALAQASAEPWRATHCNRCSDLDKLAAHTARDHGCGSRNQWCLSGKLCGGSDSLTTRRCTGALLSSRPVSLNDTRHLTYCRLKVLAMYNGTFDSIFEAYTQGVKSWQELNLHPADFHGQNWNYSVQSRQLKKPATY